MQTLIDYFEQYLKQEGLSGKIPDYRKQIVLKTPPTAIVITWLGGTWALYIIFHWLFLGKNKLALAVTFPCVIFMGVFFLTAGYYAIKQIKLKTKVNPSASSIGGVFLLCYPVLLIFIFILINRNLIATGSLVVSYIALFVILIVANSTYFFQTMLELVRVYIGIFIKSVSTLLTLFPLLLVVVLLSVFSQDLWLILGNISWTRFLLTTAALAVPPVILSYLKLNDEAKVIEGAYPAITEIPGLLTNIKYFAVKLEKGLISSREWSKLTNDLSWRDIAKLRDNNQRWLHSIIISRLGIFTEITSLLLTLAFVIYFTVVFSLLIPHETITNWTGLNLTYKTLQLGSNNTEWLVPSTVIPIFKVSLALAIIVTLTARISTLTDSDFRANVFSWLEGKAQAWKTTLVAYDCALMPNYQWLRYRVKNNRILNIDILTKPGLEKKDIEAASRLAASLAHNSVYLIIVTAFEKEEGRTDYDYGYPGKSWRLLINRAKKIDVFSDQSSYIGDNLRLADDLGFEMLDQNKEIPDAWFGNDVLAVQLGKQIWESDPEHNLILHPYIQRSSDHFFCEIAITRKLEKSLHYRDLIGRFLNIAVKIVQDFETINIQLFYRNTTNFIAWLDYISLTNQVVYKDEFSPKYQYSPTQKWIKNN